MTNQYIHKYKHRYNCRKRRGGKDEEPLPLHAVDHGLDGRLSCLELRQLLVPRLIE
jgi:hypothetical protein